MKAESRTATTCLFGEAATAATTTTTTLAVTPLIAVPRLETKWKISEEPRPFLPSLALCRTQSQEKCKSTGTRDVLPVDRIPPFSNLRLWEDDYLGCLWYKSGNSLFKEVKSKKNRKRDESAVNRHSPKKKLVCIIQGRINHDSRIRVSWSTCQEIEIPI